MIYREMLSEAVRTVTHYKNYDGNYVVELIIHSNNMPGFIGSLMMFDARYRNMDNDQIITAFRKDYSSSNVELKVITAPILTSEYCYITFIPVPNTIRLMDMRPAVFK